ncbi:hypothetical protein [Kangiella sp. HZ709]|uniref:hypothetical protein n=1 Tax=Kangiella sp. HZ709 TaxID=2666328 RepID=UPI0012B11E9E|nr:hypothetical protein [Kangiella sp. HZ709]MRX26660.1 hypothetical protein [Kangiella sp. HZ709]
MTYKRYLLLLIILLRSAVLTASEINVEEARINKANQALKATASRYSLLLNNFNQVASKLSKEDLSQLSLNYANNLWLNSVADVQSNSSTYDDRSLYWARLKLSAAIKQVSNIKEPIFWEMERASRGQNDINFSDKATKKILITGFDPFFLDRNIGQSNPSGLAALMLDGKTYQIDDELIQIESAIFPVRFADFDHGEVERFLEPYLSNNAVDMIVTISMGRDHFDLERFPALRRSAEAPDNLNVYTGATKINPLVPKVGENTLQGPEFVEFSLPVEAMQSIKTPYKVNDRRTVSTTDKTFDAQSLKELLDKTSVSGSGGGYLSNEISYRSINLARKLNSKIAIGHLHTPRIQGFDPKAEKAIVEQIKNIIISGGREL